MSAILKAENRNKQYRLGTAVSVTYSLSFSCWWVNRCGKEGLYLQVDTAAGHAICNTVGLKVMRTNTDKELQYNKA